LSKLDFTAIAGVANRPRSGGGSVCVSQVGGEGDVLDNILDSRSIWIIQDG
jgi:hypothetical protein